MKKFFTYSYYFLIENSRFIFNRILFLIITFFIKLFKITNINVFADSNGWFITLKYGDYIFKFVGPFTFIRINYSLKTLKTNLRLLSEYKLKTIPEFKISTLYISFKYIENAQKLDKYIMSIKSSFEKVDFFIKLFNEIDMLHIKNFLHGDLKTKNIIVSNNNIFFIDLENLTINNNNYEQNIINEYNKLIPDIIYFLDKDELKNVIKKINSKLLISYIKNKYLKSDNILDVLKGYGFVNFEKVNYTKDEDIDIEVESIKYYKKLVDYFKKIIMISLIFIVVQMI